MQNRRTLALKVVNFSRVKQTSGRSGFVRALEREAAFTLSYFHSCQGKVQLLLSQTQATFTLSTKICEVGDVSLSMSFSSLVLTLLKLVGGVDSVFVRQSAARLYS